MTTRVRLHWGLLSLAALLLLACGPPSTPAHAAPVRPVPSLSSNPVSTPSTVPEATPAAPVVGSPPVPPPAQPDSYFVSFSGLAAGSYPVHLHRVCNGQQGYHLAYLPYLYVSAGSGGVAVPAGDFGHGWCVVVYANRTATVVAAYRPI